MNIQRHAQASEDTEFAQTHTEDSHSRTIYKPRCQHLILAFQPPECGDNTFLLCKLPSLWSFAMVARADEYRDLSRLLKEKNHINTESTQNKTTEENQKGF